MRLAPTQLTGRQLDFSASLAEPRYSIGHHLEAAPTSPPNTGTNVPNWGMCELVMVGYAGAAALAPGRLVHMDKDFNIIDMPNTANTGRPVYVTLTNFSAGSTTKQYGWVLRSGICPVQFAVAATAGAMFVGAAGQGTPTAAAGKALLNAWCLIAAASAFTRSIYTQSGSKQVKVVDVSGIFHGVTVSGTGVPASSEVERIEPGGNAFWMTEAATATGQVTGTFTPTGFGICQVDRAFVQGQIT